MPLGFAKAQSACALHPTVITGAGGDLGRELAVRLAGSGSPLALLDADGDRLESTMAACRQIAPKITTWVADVTSYNDISAIAEDIRARQGPAHALYNLAGVIHAGLLVDSTPADLERVIRVDLLGTMTSSKAFLPQLAETGHGTLVNVSSALGLLAAPGYTAYSAAKFGVRGFTEALQQEVDRSKVSVSAVYPGGVQTGIMRRATYASTADRDRIQQQFDQSVARLSTAKAVTQLIAGVGRGRRRIVIGADATMADLLVRVVGTGYQRVTGKMWLRNSAG